MAVAHSPSAAASSSIVATPVMKITPEALDLKQKRGKRSALHVLVRPPGCGDDAVRMRVLLVEFDFQI